MRMKTALTDAVRQAEDDAGGRLGCHICDSRGDVWAAHRADERFVTASVIKVPILVTLAAAVEAGDHRWSDLVPLDPDGAAAGSGVLQHLSLRAYTLRDLATLMIIVSDNRATNLIIDRLGLDRVNDYCAGAGWPNTVLGRRMYDFDARARGRENVSTPRETADLFVRLLAGTLLPAAATETVLGILRAQQLHDKLPAWLPPDTPAAHKTGELPGVQNDCGILFLPSGPVVAAVYTNDVETPARGRLAVQAVGRAIVEAASIGHPD
jgi:beta-lactamase class A